MTTLVQSLYHAIIVDMLEFQNEYYVPFLFVGIVLITAAFVYHQRVRNNNKRTTTKTGPSSLPASSSSSSLTTYLRPSVNLKPPAVSSPSASFISSSPSASNQLYRPAALLNLKPPAVSSPSASFISSSPSASNQLYRKDDYETRYDTDGTRYQCVSVPFRLTQENKVEILMITSRGKGDYIFPGGGWEIAESAAEAARREAFEEAGIRGSVVKQIVADQHYTSDKGNKSRLWGFLLAVDKLEDEWPESERRRKWMSIDEAERALSKKRRIKFGALWSNAIDHFIEQNLYHPPNSNEKQHCMKKKKKNGYQISHSYLSQISSRCTDEKNSQESF
eukprot:CAMPEP_0197076436 /NCGR_PEP_ID=MMETSP1384-20130603/212111_1 /TAXON_ID=29189 /ORGANISM="Ammonia sp." /LENGTH=333 /DNA_ID=CAMNT_0042515293 /DNA_START=49 /DNA_END=1051 /DNA_ORIENTATION=-